MDRRKFIKFMAKVPAVAIVPSFVRDFGIPADPYVVQTLDDAIYRIMPMDSPLLTAMYAQQFGQPRPAAVKHQWVEDKLVSTPISEEEMYIDPKP